VVAGWQAVGIRKLSICAERRYREVRAGSRYS
jgi:hypothetical protein